MGVAETRNTPICSALPSVALIKQNHVGIKAPACITNTISQATSHNIHVCMHAMQINF